jgi:hypothetical protein
MKFSVVLRYTPETGIFSMSYTTGWHPATTEHVCNLHEDVLRFDYAGVITVIFPPQSSGLSPNVVVSATEVLATTEAKRRAGIIK